MNSGNFNASTITIRSASTSGLIQARSALFAIKSNKLSDKCTNSCIIKGDVRKTLPSFLKKNSELKVSLLHLDMDIYEPTKFVLKKMFDRVVRGGIILIDDYNAVPGATKAIDEFLKKNRSLKIQKLGFYKLPAFIKKM